jgi:hypothetical protein
MGIVREERSRRIGFRGESIEQRGSRVPQRRRGATRERPSQWIAPQYRGDRRKRNALAYDPVQDKFVAKRRLPVKTLGAAAATIDGKIDVVGGADRDLGVYSSNTAYKTLFLAAVTRNGPGSRPGVKSKFLFFNPAEAWESPCEARSRIGGGRSSGKRNQMPPAAEDRLPVPEHVYIAPLLRHLPDTMDTPTLWH